MQIENETIKQQVRAAPAMPGVYQMIKNTGEVLYVGKAKDLRKRLQNYVRSGGHSLRISKMISEVDSVKVDVVQSELEALILEANLIKELAPKYNVLLRDDKTFPYIKVTDHLYPRILKFRGKRQKGRDLFMGPFADVGAVDVVIDTLQKVFLLRNCSDRFLSSRTRPCLQYQIKRCSAPCVEKVSSDSYQELAKQAVDVLHGKSESVRGQLFQKMTCASDAMDYEKAAFFRDRIQALSEIQKHQIIDTSLIGEADIIAFCVLQGSACIDVLSYREGSAIGKRSYFFNRIDIEASEKVLSDFMGQFYLSHSVPKEIYVSHAPAEKILLEEGLSQARNMSTKILVPQLGEKKKMIDAAVQVAQKTLKNHLQKTLGARQLLKDVAEAFDMENVPRRIEIYDNSHLVGTHAVGAMVVAGAEGFIKKEYRKFNMKDTSLNAGDDYGMMREMMRRRFREPTAETMPDLMLIDGGKGQISSVEEALAGRGVLEKVTVVGIAKGENRHAGQESFFLIGQKEPVLIARNSPVFYYLQRLRDEAHRFAIGAHKTRRKKGIEKSLLDSIPHVGAARKKMLLRHFGSVQNIKEATLLDLQNVSGVSQKLAQEIYDFLHDAET
ncbi:MAG: excinuclease ABC subunit UvrC [Alphaproteobacteria bacterium]